MEEMLTSLSAYQRGVAMSAAEEKRQREQVRLCSENIFLPAACGVTNRLVTSRSVSGAMQFSLKLSVPCLACVFVILFLVGCVPRGVRRGGQRGAQCPGRRITGVRRKVSTMSQLFLLVQHISSRNTSGSNMGSPNLFLVPGAI